jgi:phage tail-like protein
MNDEYPYTAFRFDVQLHIDNPQRFELSNPLCDAAFAECDGLEMTMEPKTVREGGNNTEQIHLVGPVSYASLTLKRGMTGNLDLWRWFSAAAGGEGRGLTAAGLVIMRDGAGVPKLHFKLTGCLPIKIMAPALDAREGLLAIEEMQIAYRSFTIEAATP